MKKPASTLCFLVVIGLLQAPELDAQTNAGSIDLSFHGTGWVSTLFYGTTTSEEARAIAIQPDGKLVVAGTGSWDFAIARLNINGTLDSTFGVGGKVTVDFDNGIDEANGVVIQPDRKIVVVGQGGVENGKFAIARILANGTLDSSFGTGGKVIYGFGAAVDFEWATSIILQTDGKLLVAGRAIYQGQSDFGLLRLNADGSLDSTFGSGGMVATDFPGGQTFDAAYALTLQPDGKIIVVGDVYVEANRQSMGVSRYTTNGVLDITFGTNGLVTLNYGNRSCFANGVAVQPDGKIVVGGAAGDTGTDFVTGGFVLSRLETNGVFDPSFASNGITMRYVTGSSNNTAYGLLLQPDGKIVMCGSSDPQGTNDSVIIRFNADGIFDEVHRYYSTNPNRIEEARAIALHSDGRIAVAGYSQLNDNSDFVVLQVTTNLHLEHDLRFWAFPTSTKPANAVAVTTQPDGKIIAIGGTDPNFGQGDVSVARYLQNGDLDASFANGGLFMFDYQQTNDFGHDAIVQPDGKIVIVAGHAYIPSSTNEAYLLRLLPDGALDPGFGSGGRVPLNFGQPGVSNSIAYKDAKRIALQTDGKILVLGQVYFNNGPNYPNFNSVDSVLSRLNPNGTPDITFGSEGTVSIPGDKDVKAFAVQSDRKIVMVTTTLIFRRFLSNGVPDTTFGNQGVFTSSAGGRVNDMTLLSDGRILGVGYDASGYRIQLICLTTNGNPDSNFGNGGIVTNNFGAWRVHAASVVLQRDGRILITGDYAQRTFEEYRYMVARFLTNGVADATFGTNGVGTFSLDSWALQASTDIALQRDGGIVVIGYASGIGNFMVARFLNDQMNELPVISAIADQTILEDTSITIPFAISDWETPVNELSLNAFSSNTNLFPLGALTLAGSDENRTLMLFPLTNQFGSATITLNLSDGITNVAQPFEITVNPVHIPPSLSRWFLGMDNRLLVELTGEIGKTYAIEASSNLVQWSEILSVTNTGTTTIVLDNISTNAQQFLRTRIP